MKFLHSLSHLLGLNRPYKDLFIQDNWLVSGNRCPTCNQVSDLKKIVPEPMIDALTKK